MYLGVDIGGTFTDLVLMDGDGVLTTTKALSTPGELEVGVFEAIRRASEQKGLAPEDLLSRVEAFGHGTTQATNALIERTGARTGLLATRGFGDTLSLQRLMGFTAGVPVDHLGWYSRRRYPDPVVPRHLVREIPERVDQAGTVLLAMDEEAVRQAVRELADAGVETYAVAFLWSFRNTAHERRAGEIIAEICPDAYVSLSCDVAPVIGEYERTATTALNSYLAPKVVTYLDRIEGLLRDRGFRGAFSILNSSGGVMPVAEAARRPIALVTSGPTGGVMGSLELAKTLGHRNVITSDMGGTSFDVALIVDGKPLLSANHEAGGFHLAAPMIDIRAVGAGGGSIARVEDDLLRVGPESAGARPGPACYGRGGKLATVTDADVVLGIIDPDNFLGGRMKLDRAAAARVIEDQIARPLGITVEAAAAGIRRIVDAHMADTLREVTIGRGHDPRDFVLFAYGGAGPVHCAGFGAELGVRRIVVPVTSMAHSAYGALASDVHHAADRSVLMKGGGGTGPLAAGLDPQAIERHFGALEADCAAAMVRAGIPDADVTLVRTVSMRYRRQTHDLMIEVPERPVTAEALETLVARFEETYEAVYGKGSGFRLAGIELTNVRVEAIGRTKRPALRAATPGRGGEPTTRPVFDPAADRWLQTRIHQWQDLALGQRIAGPAVIEHPETAIFVATGQTAELDATNNIVIEVAHVTNEGARA